MRDYRLYSFWRSQAAYRVRIALHLKRVAATIVTVDFASGEQRSETYRAINPNLSVPALFVDDGAPLVSSLAILDYLEEVHPDPAILPEGPRDRAHARALAHAVAVDAHPFIVPRVRDYLEQQLGAGAAARAQWIRHWLDRGLDVAEAMLSGDARTGRFCLGGTPTIADICLVAHITSAKMLFDYDLGRWPTAGHIYQTCMTLPAFLETHPLRQPGAPSELEARLR
ncbi:maleylacetoacetate isomerase [Rhizobiales bacterium L72]|uniref:Maleylacetoacetate isomerase n=2 Tax=Propylenella binzhouense TaxID=2555902 RepID=A0A964T8A4_9HYPH|nr:maleylacetoacetate isomerase [Propylenella binzhouense]MYZ50386.1 maleylacetoacetate isomerase [Propylenella binzhouense]